MTSNSLRLLPEVITGVGFCMYTTRQALDLCGLLDEETFGRGYGEEVDFCLRATRLGLRHLVEDSTFVYHRGGGSFGDEQSEGLGSRLATPRRALPVLPADQHARARAGPARACRSPRSSSACTSAIRERPHVLHIMHSPPGDTGGTEKFLDALMHVAARTSSTSRCSIPVASGFVLHTFWARAGRRPSSSTSSCCPADRAR